MRPFAGIIALTVALLGPAAWAQDTTVPARQALSPTGTLRVALLTLPHMAIQDPSTGQYTGVNADIGRELARRLGVTAEFVAVGSNVAAVDEIKAGRADVTFLVALPELTTQIDFGPAYPRLRGGERRIRVPPGRAFRAGGTCLSGPRNACGRNVPRWPPDADRNLSGIGNWREPPASVPEVRHGALPVRLGLIVVVDLAVVLAAPIPPGALVYFGAFCSLSAVRLVR